MKVCVACLAAATLAVSWQTPAFGGQVFFSNLVQPGDQYGPDGLGIGHTPFYQPGATGEATGATGFVASNTFRLTFIDIALVYAEAFPSNGPNQADVFLMNDAGGLPGSTIESWHVTNLPVNCGPCSLTSIASSSNPILAGGSAYWVAATGGPETFDLWTFSLLGSNFAPLAVRNTLNGADSGWSLSSPPNTRQGALQIVGEAIPEPGTWALTVLALPGLIFRRQRLF
ncbi:MAG TPA: PEP-CTERM sorting domain-containing protein [Bryobacteraceae bacterium]|jgi:hypothetical protein